jgi:hypothetical protein
MVGMTRSILLAKRLIPSQGKDSSPRLDTIIANANQ